MLKPLSFTKNRDALLEVHREREVYVYSKNALEIQRRANMDL